MGDDMKDDLEQIKADLEKLTSNVQKNDFWDKLSVISTFLASVLIASVGGVFTYYYNLHKDAETISTVRLQNSINYLSAVVKFFPHLTDKTDDKRKTLALETIALLGTEQLAYKLSQIVNSPAAQDRLMSGVSAPVQKQFETVTLNKPVQDKASPKTTPTDPQKITANKQQPVKQKVHKTA